MPIFTFLHYEAGKACHCLSVLRVSKAPSAQHDPVCRPAPWSCPTRDLNLPVHKAAPIPALFLLFVQCMCLWQCGHQAAPAPGIHLMAQ